MRQALARILTYLVDAVAEYNKGRDDFGRGIRRPYAASTCAGTPIPSSRR
jgi:hypothetical protein